MAKVKVFNKFVFSSILFQALVGATNAHAWEVKLHTNPHLPSQLIGVSKADRNLFVLDIDENFKVTEAFPSIHGEIEGDKELEGDLKTPEGVYFVTTRIKTQLDFEKYGSGAYVLNYPNPIDIIKQKTGHGIWIHSKGNPIDGQVTQGCVAVDLEHFERLREYLPNGTAVVLAENIEAPYTIMVEDSRAQKLEKEQRIAEQMHKEQTSAQAEQERIELELAQKEEAERLALVKKAEEEKIVARPKPRSLAYFTIGTAKAIAGTVSEESLHEIQASNTNSTLMNAEANNEIQLASLSTEIAPTTQLPLQIIEKADLKNPDYPMESSEQASILVEKTKLWNDAWEARSDAFFDFYDTSKYGLAQSESYEEFKAQKDGLFEYLPWIQIIYGDVYAAEGTDYWVTWFEQHYRAPNTSAEGTRRLYWQKDQQGQYKIVAMEWIPAHIGLEEMYMANITPEIEATVENWKNAWLSGEVDKYREFYLSNATQDLRVGEEIFQQKADIWVKKKPKAIDFRNIQITPEGNMVRVSMDQNYSDISGYKDRGRKVIYFVLENDTWLIAKETWKKI